MSDLIVTSPLVQLRQKNGSYVHLYEGAPVPADADAEHVKHLKELGMVGEPPEPAADDSDAPAKSAAKAEWEAYARSQGATEEDLKGKTKDELVSAYGS